MNIEAIEIECSACATVFTWTVSEQVWMRENIGADKVQTPKRCKECRAHRKRDREAGWR